MFNRSNSVVSFALVTALFGFGTVACTGNASPDEDLSETEAALSYGEPKKDLRSATPSNERTTTASQRVGFATVSGTSLSAEDRRLAAGAPGSFEKESVFGRERSPFESGERKMAPGAPGSNESEVAVGNRAGFGPMQVARGGVLGGQEREVAKDLDLAVQPMKAGKGFDSVEEEAVSPKLGRAPLAPMTEVPPAPSVTCYDARPLPPLRGSAPRPGQQRCTTEEIQEMSTRCLMAGAGSSECSSYIEKHASCGACVMGRPNEVEKPTLGALNPARDGQVVVNTASCAAFVLEHEECAQPLAVQETCFAAACSTCGSRDTMDWCRSEASKPGGACAASVNAACSKIMDDGRSRWEPKCVGGTREETFTKVAALYCMR